MRVFITGGTGLVGSHLIDDLKGQAETLGIADRIKWRGAMAQAEVIAMKTVRFRLIIRIEQLLEA